MAKFILCSLIEDEIAEAGWEVWKATSEWIIIGDLRNDCAIPPLTKALGMILGANFVKRVDCGMGTLLLFHWENK